MASSHSCESGTPSFDPVESSMISVRGFALSCMARRSKIATGPSLPTTAVDMRDRAAATIASSCR